MRLTTLPLLALLAPASLAAPSYGRLSTSIDTLAVPRGYSIECRSEAGNKLCKESDEALNHMSCRGTGEVFGVEGSRFEYCAQDCVCVSLSGACGDRTTC